MGNFCELRLVPASSVRQQRGVAACAGWEQDLENYRRFESIIERQSLWVREEHPCLALWLLSCILQNRNHRLHRHWRRAFDVGLFDSCMEDGIRQNSEYYQQLVPQLYSLREDVQRCICDFLIPHLSVCR